MKIVTRVYEELDALNNVGFMQSFSCLPEVLKCQSRAFGKFYKNDIMTAALILVKPSTCLKFQQHFVEKGRIKLL